jgi:hypothetical protein
MWKVLGSVGATLAVVLVMAAVPVSAGATHSGSQGCATKAACATSGLRAAVASAPDAAGHVTPSGVHDAGDHVDFSLPSARTVAPAGAAGHAGEVGLASDITFDIDQDWPSPSWNVNVQRSPTQVNLMVPTAMVAAPAGAAGPAPGRMAVDPDGLERVTLPLNDTGSAALGTVRTPGAPEFGFDVSVQAARPFFPDGVDDGPQFGYDVSAQTSRDQMMGVVFGPTSSASSNEPSIW